MQKIDKLANYANPKSLGNKFREKRFNFFKSKIKNLPKPMKILDVGGTQLFWVNRGFHNNPNYHITLLNLHKEPSDYSNIQSIVGDATNLSDYEDNHFDLVFSNSVIEHLFTYQNQEKMAAEVQRVGHYHYIQTPNYYFFIEPHYLLPFFQFLPRSLQLFILTKTRLSRGIKYTKEAANAYLDEIQLLSKKQYKRLFPESLFYKEKFLGMTKSITAHNIIKKG
ncbi:class I SAM-dependent methyltransferase [uncultured Microscilla sp.]|uniref:class I SAM-dependent methyltransferase n=1 Tax=uncultured Microscilla sp. TaxID=432653 RepID=UPI00261302FF|nr:class I SAM-dependent methyltransferase [uncultured Microscilla sp.]